MTLVELRDSDDHEVLATFSEDSEPGSHMMLTIVVPAPQGLIHFEDDREAWLKALPTALAANSSRVYAVLKEEGN
jgi:hypothetical protein